MIVNVGTTPTLITKVNVSVQVFVQNQGANTVYITPDGTPGGTEIGPGQTLILVVQNPLSPVVNMYGIAPGGNTSLDVQEWPF